MKRKSYFIFLLCASHSFFAAHAQQTGKVTPSGIGYLEYLPDGYRSNSNKYPVVIALHGIKEKGTSSTDPKLVLADLPKVAYVGLPKYVKSGAKYPFILISPQLKSNHWLWPPSFIMEVLNHVKKTLRVDDRRIYLTGLSLGGFGVWQTAGQYPDVFAAISPLCPGGNALDKANTIAAANVPIWGFHGGSDPVVSYTVTTNMINAVNMAPKKPNPLAKVTIFPNMGHAIWDKAYNETDLLKWMLSFTKGTSTPDNTGDTDSPEVPEEDAEEANTLPVVNAGGDKVITLPTNAVSLQATASDSDGEVVSFSWSKVRGGAADLSGTNSAQLSVRNLVAGTYEFKVTVKDNDGATKSDNAIVTVKEAVPENIPPAASAGPDQRLQLPQNSLQLKGTATDKDGSIVSWKWTQISGNAVSIGSSASATASITNLKAGTYVFKFTVKDNKGAISSDETRVDVLAEPKEVAESTASTGSTASAGSSESTPSTESEGSTTSTESGGSAGSTASTGSTESSGSTGATESNGSTGSTESSGSTASNGSGESTGSTGATGSTGSAGTESTGSTGSGSTETSGSAATPDPAPSDVTIVPSDYTGSEKDKSVKVDLVHPRGSSWYKGTD